MMPLELVCDSPELKLLPTFGLYQEIPSWASKQLENAVSDFIRTSGVPRGVDIDGFRTQTYQTIASCTYLRSGGDLWLGHQEGHLLSYVIGYVSTDIDNKLTYHVSQAWVHESVRGERIVKEWWQQVRQRAKDLLCSHIVVTSTRGNQAYCRFLGKGWHEYAVLLKEDI